MRIVVGDMEVMMQSFWGKENVGVITKTVEKSQVPTEDQGAWSKIIAITTKTTVTQVCWFID